MIVALDGPAGAGKSSVARAVARALGVAFVDTGAMYRAVALAALERGVALDDGDALGALAAALRFEPREDRITLGGRDVTDRIRHPDVTEAVSKVSAHPAVRSALLARQREIAAAGDVVMEGRDIGSTVVPGAEVKVFLTAALEERARRRIRQLELPEDAATIARVEAAIAARDAADASRPESPLAKADDAVELDTTGMSFEDVVAAVVRLAEARR